MKSLSRSSSSSPTRRTPSCGGPGRLDVRVVGDQAGAEGGHPLREEHADAAEPDHADGLALQISTPVYLERFHSPAFSDGAGGGGVAGDGEQQRDGLLGGGDDVRGGRVDDHDAAGGRGGYLDVVQSDAGPGDDLQPRRGRDGLGVDLGGAAYDDRVASASAASRAGRSVPSTWRTSKSSASTSSAEGASSSAISTTARSAGRVIRSSTPVGH